MKHVLKTATIAALAVVTLTAATQQQQRYRYLGHTGQGVAMATEATGPQNARKLQTIVATASAALPGEADNAEVGLIIDCVANTAAINGLVTYLGTEEKIRTDAGTAQTPISAGSPNEVFAAMACGKPIAGTPLWLDGSAKARAYALAEAKKK